MSGSIGKLNLSDFLLLRDCKKMQNKEKSVYTFYCTVNQSNKLLIIRRTPREGLHMVLEIQTTFFGQGQKCYR